MSRSLSPNQQRKREQIVDAARRVLARDGLAACTVRAVADESPLTKSAVHYYFDDVEEIVDAAMAAHLRAFADGLRAAAEAEPEPARRVAAVVDAYLATFAEQPRAAALWFEYWIARTRQGDPAPARADLAELRGLLRETLEAAGRGGAEATADAILSWLLGAVVQESVVPLGAHARRRALERLLAEPTP